VDNFVNRCTQLALVYGEGFSLKADVIACLKQNKPIY
jgi:hypothetical protein